MGGLLCCCGGSSDEQIHHQKTSYGHSNYNATPDPETRRQQMGDAAMRRAQQSDGRGIKDPQALRDKQKKMERYEQAQQQRGFDDGKGGLRWNVG